MDRYYSKPIYLVLIGEIADQHNLSFCYYYQYIYERSIIMLINSIGCINSMCQNNNTISNYKSKPMTNNNVSFGRSISYYTALMDAEHSKGCIESSKAVLKYLSEKIMPKRRVPKDGVWGVVGSKLNNMITSGEINPEKLTDYKIRKVHIEVPYEGKNYSHLERVLRRTFTKSNIIKTYTLTAN